MTFVQEQDNGQTVTIHVDDELKIVLPENATTGYRWALDRVDAAFVDAVAAEPRYTGNTVGSGGTVAFVFRARKAGTSHLNLKQWRHWEGDASVIARFGITLQILPSAAKPLGQP